MEGIQARQYQFKVMETTEKKTSDSFLLTQEHTQKQQDTRSTCFVDIELDQTGNIHFNLQDSGRNDRVTCDIRNILQTKTSSYVDTLCSTLNEILANFMKNTLYLSVIIYTGVLGTSKLFVLLATAFFSSWMYISIIKMHNAYTNRNNKISHILNL